MSFRAQLTSFRDWERQNAELKTSRSQSDAVVCNSSDRPAETNGHRKSKIRSNAADACLIALTCLAAFAAIAYAKAVTMPLTMAVLLYLVLRPVMKSFAKWHVPAVAGATICLVVMSAIVFGAIFFLTQPTRQWVNDAPGYMYQLKLKLSGLEEQLENVEEVSDKISDVTNGNDADEIKPMPVEIKQPRLLPGLNLLSSTGGFAAGLVITFGTLFFLLAYGDEMIENLIAGFRTGESRKRAHMLIFDLQHGMSSYLLTITVINALLGVATGTAMWLLGMPNPLLIGTMAFLFNYIPFLGAWVGTGIVFVVAVLQFDSFAYALLVPITYFTLTSLEGQFITPCILGRSMSMNPLLVFLFLAVWGWIWGIGGVFLAVPLLAVLKIVADYFPSLEWISRTIMMRDTCPS
ncbi:MAG: AI-2E family transporter [Rubinisphaera brasiliensis]|uniref:AI-2E family transporter n=1 Tax=Rubinisphaera brasiliensis TaxID=119 RepID=UPI00391A4D57